MTEIFSINPLRICCSAFALAWGAGSIFAEERAAFIAPQSPPVSRYESMWQKNPFTLRTAQVTIQNASFAEHLVIASVYGNLDDPTVVLVNVKTHERIRLKTSQAAMSGMKLERLNGGSGKRDEMLAIVSQGAETSEIRFGTDYIKQVAAAQTARATQSVLQKRQQSLSQHSGSVALPPSATQQQTGGGSSAVTDVTPGSVLRQDAWLLAGSFSGKSPSGQAGSSHSDNHSSPPSLAENLPDPAHMALRRYTFRMGDELPIPHPDPQ